ncbi:metallophosphoesterase family protein [Sansalvadorimonas sp. 2012CJ34-2]|uniref:Metallophosphoesterase family protein n=1 Tax=Parendozoicomonas callyspongiae TaxID=2942213 RepID=A0ABT0PCC4_9GAMM|nr:metallophosphoesterase family protein [Sansalvadorimonas sp. 2012CJ34-2]MCL6269034.1 metallophosphoesterase family protein [Sansalvadorimonas sp. 2012CJ34-2]
MRTAKYTIIALCLLIYVAAVYVVTTPSLLSASSPARLQSSPESDLKVPPPEETVSLIDRIILTLTNHPATSIGIQWRSNKTLKNPQLVQYLPTPESEIDPQTAKSVLAQKKKSTDNSFEHWQTTLTSLTPETSYSYRVGNQDHWSEWFQLMTAADHNKPFNILFFGDIQEGIKEQWPRIFRNAWLTHPDASFMLFVGDLVNKPDSGTEWHDFFQSLGWLASIKPMVAIPGDHEYNDKILSPFWNKHFQFPAYEPDTSCPLNNTAYYFDYQGIRFIALNTYAMRGLKLKETLQQYQWIKQLLENNPNNWTVVFQHEEAWSSALGKSDKHHLKLLFAPLYEQYNVDLILQGDSHVYSRGQRKTKENQRLLPVYISSSSGTKFRHSSSNWADRQGEFLQLYQHISFGNNQLVFKSITATGRIFDQFTIKTDSRGKSVLQKPPS